MSLVAVLRVLLVQRNWILSKYERLSSNLNVSVPVGIEIVVESMGRQLMLLPEH